MPTSSSQRGRAFRARRKDETIRDVCWHLAQLGQDATAAALQTLAAPQLHRLLSALERERVRVDANDPDP
jgi:hypothetical protein